MANSLGLDDDLDGVELVQNIEKAFDVKIADQEAERILVVGELYDLLLSKIPTSEANKKCASAMTFYRLRRAIRKLGADGDYGPSSEIRFLEENGVKASFGKMEVETGLQLPKPPLMLIGVSGCLVLFLSLQGFRPTLTRRSLGMTIRATPPNAASRWIPPPPTLPPPSHRHP